MSIEVIVHLWGLVMFATTYAIVLRIKGKMDRIIKLLEQQNRMVRK